MNGINTTSAITFTTKPSIKVYTVNNNDDVDSLILNYVGVDDPASGIRASSIYTLIAIIKPLTSDFICDVVDVWQLAGSPWEQGATAIHWIADWSSGTEYHIKPLSEINRVPLDFVDTSNLATDETGGQYYCVRLAVQFRASNNFLPTTDYTFYKVYKGPDKPISSVADAASTVKNVVNPWANLDPPNVGYVLLAFFATIIIRRRHHEHK